MMQTSIQLAETTPVPVGLGSSKIHLIVGPFACTSLIGVRGFANAPGNETHAINESTISYPWAWITLIAIISLLVIRFLYIKTIFNLKASKLLSKELGLRNYRTLENLSKYDVFKHIIAINTYRNNIIMRSRSFYSWFFVCILRVICKPQNTF